MVIGTKFGSPVDGGAGGASPAYVRTAVERSLTALGTDRIDLYQLHHAPAAVVDTAEVLGVLDALVREGKVRAIGASNFSAWRLAECAELCAAHGWTPFATVQNYWHLLARGIESEAVAEAVRLGIGYLPYYPLASGMLSGKYARGVEAPAGTRLVHFGERGGGMLSDRNFDIVDAAAAWAAERGHSVLELALAWLAAKPVVASVIAGATKPEQVRANAAAAGWALTPDEVAEVDALAPPA